MDIRLPSPTSPLAPTALLGSCGLHLLTLLLLAGWMASEVPVQLPRLANPQVMTLATTDTPAAANPVQTKPSSQPVPAAKAAPAPRITRPSRVASPPAPAAPSHHAEAATSPAAATSPDTAAQPAETVNHTPPAPAVHEPLYRGGYLNNPKPGYPPLSVELEESGTVQLKVQVSVQGLPVSVELERSSGFPRLDRAALTAVRSWKFVPARRGNEAILYTFIVPVEFSLKNQRKP